MLPIITSRRSGILLRLPASVVIHGGNMQVNSSNAIANIARSVQDMNKLTMQITDKVQDFNGKMLGAAVKDQVETSTMQNKLQQINELA